MIDEIIETVGKYADEKVKISKGLLILLTVGAFVVGILTGTAVTKLVSHKKAVCRCSSDEDFDADEYVRNLSFDDDEE
ncbi:hypothetical protein [Huintestinicola sp.]|uniref:hypothetical protein n=1 Tax=Huintestinicola sp. TaxID=2981661 RepID=UPI003D7D231A